MNIEGIIWLNQSERGRLVRFERGRETSLRFIVALLMAGVATPRFAGVGGRAVRAPTQKYFPIFKTL